MSADARLLRLKANLDALRAAIEFALQGADVAGLPEERAAQLELVMEEVFVNIASYAYPRGTPGDVELRWEVPAPGRIRVEVADQGGEYNPTLQKTHLAESLGDTEIGGLGVYLVKQFTESLHYRREGGWNRLWFEMGAETRGT